MAELRELLRRIWDLREEMLAFPWIERPKLEN
jgi:hypothetical protein